MNLKEIKELIKIIDSSSLSELHIEQQDLKLTIKKEVIVQQVNTNGFNLSEYVEREKIAELNIKNMDSAIGRNSMIEKASDATVDEATDIEDKNIHIIKSPIVGVFYGSPTPETPEFVKVGDSIKTGQVLCIVEAMKMMNEIISDVDGEVVEILGQNQGPVEFGQSLFKIRKA